MGLSTFLGNLIPNRNRLDPGRNLQKTRPETLQERQNRGRIIAVASGKGGVGKTTLSTSVGFALGKMDKKVLIIDMDTGLRNLDVVSGVDEMVTHNLFDVIVSENIHWEDALVQRSGARNVYILETDQTHGRMKIKHEDFTALVLDMSKFMDYVLIDCPAGIGDGFHLATAPADEAVVVTTAENASLRGAAQACSLLEKKNISPITCVINMVDAELMDNSLCADHREVATRLGVPVIAQIPFERLVRVCGHKGIPLTLWANDSEAKDRMLYIAGMLAGPVTDRIRGIPSAAAAAGKTTNRILDSADYRILL